MPRTNNPNTRSGFSDQYANAKAEVFIGDTRSRTNHYRNFIVDLLRQNNCKRILDVACGTGVDSIMLLEENFEVVSVDASAKMLMYARKERWNRQSEPSFNNWVIEEANWLTLYNDIMQHIKDGFDAVICLGNSFALLHDIYGDQREQKTAIHNFKKCIRPGGMLLIDHRNFDQIIATESTPSKCIYYNNDDMPDIKTWVQYVAGEPKTVMLDYMISAGDETSEFRLSYFPHKLTSFTKMLGEIFGSNALNGVYADLKQLTDASVPVIYLHVMHKMK